MNLGVLSSGEINFKFDKLCTMTITEQIVLDQKGNAVAVQIPMNQYKKIKEMMEELEDIKAFDKATKRKQHFSPFADAVQRIKASRKRK
jgi:hypothetical protein